LRRLALPPALQSRVTILCGDLAQKNFGLAPQTWNHLCGTVGEIVHCAAEVNMLLPYAALAPANTAPVHTLLRMARQGCKKRLHHASTLSVFVSTDANTGIAREDTLPSGDCRIYGGYAQSKWAAEYLLRHEKDVAVYRFGLVTPDAATGAASRHDFLRTFLHGITALGCVPEGAHENLTLDVTPIDYAARQMFALMRAGKSGTYHIANEKGFVLAQLLRGLARAGHAIAVLPIAAWEEHLDSRRKKSPLSPEEAAAVMAMCRCLPPGGFERHRAMDLFQATGIRFDMTATKAALGDAFTPPPAADDRLLDLYIKAFSLEKPRKTA